MNKISQYQKITACFVVAIFLSTQVSAVLVNHYTLDDDYSGSGNLATGAADSAGTTQNLSNYLGGTPTSGQSGMFGTAYEFSGAGTSSANDQILRFTQGGQIIDNMPITISTWMKTTTNNTSAVTLGGLFNALDSSDYSTLRLEDTEVAQSAFRKTGSGGTNGSRFVTASTALNDGEWHFVASTYLAGSQSLYVDGVHVGTTVLDRGDPYLRTMALGGFSGTGADQGYTGQLDDVGVWDTALTAENIALINGLGRFSGVNLADSGIEAVLNAYNTTGSAVAGSETWYYTTGLGSSTIGETGGSVGGGDAFIVLGTDGSGVALIPEPSSVILLGLSLASLVLFKRRKS